MALSNDQKTALNFKNFFDYIKAYFNQAYGSVEVPENVSDLNNDTGFITNTVNNLLNYYLKTETYTKTEINTLINNAASGGFIKVNELPSSDINIKAIYLVPYTGSKAKNLYEEYIYIDNDWEMIGTTKLDLSNYVTTTALNTALADYVTSTDINTLLADYVTASSLNTTLSGYPTTGTMNTALNGKQDKIQYSTMPTAGADYVGQILQYMGITNANYIHGYFYECVTDGTTYSWKASPTQESGGSSEGKAESSAIAPVFDDTETYAAGDRAMYEGELYVFNTAHTGAWDAADADKTDVDTLTKRMPATDMSEVASPMPSVMSRLPVLFDESGAEQVVGWYKYANGTKKPVYEKAISGTASASMELLSDVDKVIFAFGAMKHSGGPWLSIPFSWQSVERFLLWTNNGNKAIAEVIGTVYIGQPYYIIIRYTKTTDTPQ